MASPDEPQSLAAVFREAEARRRALESGAASGDQVDAVLALYARVADLAARRGVFSPNEAVDDVSTPALPLLVAPFRAAELLHHRAPFASPAHRHRALARARGLYARFLDAADAYGLVALPPYAAMLARFRDDPDAFAALPDAAGPAQRRDAKMVGFRAERRLRDRRAALEAAAAAAAADDDEALRAAHLASVALAVHAALHALDALNRELALLAHAPAPDAPPPPAAAAADADADTWRLDPPLSRARPGAGGPLLSASGAPLQPFTLVGSRADRARAVFGPGHNLPTMSIDEYLAEERRRGNLLDGGGARQQKPAAADAAAAADDDDDMDAADRATYKARRWDDFKDDNPRGSGNTLNMG